MKSYADDLPDLSKLEKVERNIIDNLHEAQTTSRDDANRTRSQMGEELKIVYERIAILQKNQLDTHSEVLQLHKRLTTSVTLLGVGIALNLAGLGYLLSLLLN